MIETDSADSSNILSTRTLAILGGGMMGGALARGLIRAGAMSPNRIRLYDPDAVRAQRLADDLGPDVSIASSPLTAIGGADTVLLAVKPPILPDVLASIAPGLTASHLILSIAAGVRLSKMEGLTPAGVPIIRSMPNTPCLVGMGATAICRGAHATAEHVEIARSLFAAVGQSVEVEERLMDAVTGLSGSGPAYVYLLIEALTDGGVKAGLTHQTARLLTAQTVLGAAEMVIRSMDHPAQLKDNVTTPGGTTIAGLAVLERAGFRIALMDAVEAAAARSKELS